MLVSSHLPSNTYISAKTSAILRILCLEIIARSSNRLEKGSSSPYVLSPRKRHTRSFQDDAIMVVSDSFKELRLASHTSLASKLQFVVTATCKCRPPKPTWRRSLSHSTFSIAVTDGPVNDLCFSHGRRWAIAAPLLDGRWLVIRTTHSNNCSVYTQEEYWLID